ncbi:hypothetical protein BKA56DRAFT_626029 [Ilyonectria sp. MPI-CAGE-AT-0026]|nr:hypothetical protein BKA56DRAFT_626029 [Ilyonectria sp. MPI-CAGE-AT-0026]
MIQVPFHPPTSQPAREPGQSSLIACRAARPYVDHELPRHSGLTTRATTILEIPTPSRVAVPIVGSPIWTSTEETVAEISTPASTTTSIAASSRGTSSSGRRGTPSRAIFASSGDGPGRILAGSQQPAYRDAALARSVSRKAAAKQAIKRTQRKISTRLTIFLARPEPLERLEEGYNPPWILAREVQKVALRRHVISEPAISVALWLSKIVFPQFQDKPAIAPYLGFENRLVHHAHLSDGITELGDFNYNQKTVGELFGEDCPFRYSKIEGHLQSPAESGPQSMLASRRKGKEIMQERGVKQQAQEPLAVDTEFNSLSLSPSPERSVASVPPVEDDVAGVVAYLTAKRRPANSSPGLSPKRGRSDQTMRLTTSLVSLLRELLPTLLRGPGASWHDVQAPSN